jgi:hypothetical protein
MALTDDVRVLCDRALTELTEVHDYYTDTKMAWRIVRKVIGAGHKVTIRNMTTGTVTQEVQLAAKARDYVAKDLAEATFQQFVSIFEHFFFDLMRLWFMAYPQSLGGKVLEFKDVLDAPDLNAVTLYVVNRELNEIAYKRPKEWFTSLESRAKLGCPSTLEIEKISEAKATRDILAHNRGVANKIYESKAGKAARYKDGDRVEIPEHYHREMWELMRKLIKDMSDASVAKFL